MQTISNLDIILDTIFCFALGTDITFDIVPGATINNDKGKNYGT